MEVIFPFKSIIFYTRTGIQYELDFKCVEKLQVSVLSHYEEMNYDAKNDVRTFSRIKRCKKLGVSVNLDNIDSGEEKDRIMKFFEGSFGMRNVDCISITFEDGSKIDHFVPENHRKHQSYQNIFYDADNNCYGVCYLGFAHSKDNFLKDCGFYNKGEKNND